MKQKHWKVSVFNKTSDIVRDDAFYTTDTEAYLVFELIDEDFTPDTATVAVYNIYGKATINANVEVVDGIVRYEMPEEAIGHPGGWRTQVVYTKDNEDYTTKIIEFDVGGHLLDNKKPAIVDIENWNSFIAHAEELIDDWEQLEEIRQANEQQRELAESARQTTFETNESTRQSEFETNEISRQTNELVREEAENNRQSTFETNEAERESKFEISESARQANELARESAESVRVSNEEERELNEAERISKDSERDSKIEAVEGLQADLISGAVDSAAVQQHVEERYGQLEEEYAPKLTEVTAQLAQKVTKGTIQKSYFDVSSDSKKIALNNVNDEFRQALTGQSPVFNGLPENGIVEEYIASQAVSIRNLNPYILRNVIKNEQITGSAVDIVVDEKPLSEDGLYGGRNRTDRNYINGHPSPDSGLLTVYIKALPETQSITVHVLQRGSDDNFKSLRQQQFQDVSGLQELQTELIVEEGQYVGIDAEFAFYQDKNKPTPIVPHFAIRTEFSNTNFVSANHSGYDQAVYYRVGGRPNLVQELLDRPAVDVVSRVFYAEDFGALGDGTTNDSLAIQDGLNALAEMGGGELVLSNKEYYIENTIYVPSNVNLNGRGRSSVLRFSLSQKFDNVETPLFGRTEPVNSAICVHSVEDVVLSNFRVEGTKGAEYLGIFAGISVHDSRKIQMNNLEVHEINPTGDGARNDRGWGILTTQSHNILISGGVYSNCGYENIGVREYSSHVIVYGTIQLESVRTCMQAVRSTYVSFVNNICRQKMVNETASHSAITAHHSENVLISGNIVESLTTVWNKGAIKLVGGNKNITITNNEIYSKMLSIQVSQTDQAIVAGNRCYAEAERAFTAGSSANIIVKNNIFECGYENEGSRVANVDFSGCPNAIIDSNVIIGDYDGINVTKGSLEQLTGVRITNNTIPDSGRYGVRFAVGIAQSIITGNMISNPKNTAIYMGRESIDNLVTQNIFVDVIKHFDIAEGEGSSVIKDNIGVAGQ